MIRTDKREGETGSAALFRFTRRVKRSGVLKEKIKRRFRTRVANKRRRRLSAIHRDTKKTEFLRSKKLGLA